MLSTPSAGAAVAAAAPRMRPYQQLAVEHVQSRLAAGAGRCYIELPTGCGKTVVLAELARLERERGGRILVIAHRRELIDQLARAMRAAVGAEAVGIVMAQSHDEARPVTVATIQSMRLPRLQRLREHGAITLLLVDEVHHVTPGNAYGRLIDNLGDARVVGCSATPFRADGNGMREVVPHCAFSRSIAQMQRGGWLCPLEWRRVRLGGLDLARIRMKRSADGVDYDQSALSAQMSAEELVDEVVESTLPLLESRRTVVAFCVTVAHAQALADAYCAAGIPALAAWGDMPREDRAEVLRAWRAGEAKVVTNCALFCLDEKTEILTDTGWVGIDEIAPTHRVANWEQGGRVYFKEPEAIVVRPREPWEDMFVLETARRSIRVTTQHRMLYRTTASGPFLKAPVDELAGRAVDLPVCGMADPLDVRPAQAAPPTAAEERRLVTATAYNLRDREGYGRPEARAEAVRRTGRRYGLRYADPGELTSAECSLIGFWLGDGSGEQLRRGGVEYRLYQSYAYPKIIEWVDRILAQAAIHAIRRDVESLTPAGVPCRSVSWSLPRGTGGGSQERRGVHRLEPYLDKAGSSLLWGLNAEQFEAFLIGCWYADGFHGDGGSPPNGDGIRIPTVRRSVVDLLQAIGVVRGWSVSVTGGKQPANPTHRPQWHMHFHRRPAHHMGGTDATYRIQREERPWAPERAWCVRTETRNIITRRRGTVTVMGNTEGFDLPAIDAVCITRPTANPGLYLQMVGRGTRTSPGKDDCLVIDVAGNISELDDHQVLLPQVWSAMPVEATEGAGGRRLGGLREVAEGRRERPLFAASPITASGVAWAEDPESGTWGFSRGLNPDTGGNEFLLLLPDPGGSGLWRSALAQVRGTQAPQLIRARRRIGTLYDEVKWLLRSVTDQPRHSRLADREAEWRRGQPTDRQLATLARLNPTAAATAQEDGWTRGEVSIAIDQQQIRRIVGALPDDLRPPMNRAAPE